MLVEGIHALNARLVQGLPLTALYRIYVSAFTQLNLDQHNRVPTTDTRLLRRIVRDAAHRGYSAADTIARWPSVRRGEKRWIFPNETNADVFFNSALVYELAALKPLASPLLLQVEPGYAGAHRGQSPAGVAAVVCADRCHRYSQRIPAARIHRRLDLRRFQALGALKLAR